MMHTILRRGALLLVLAIVSPLALAAQQEQIADLADALEILPGLLDHWDEKDAETIRFVLRNYQEKYPGSAYDFVASLEQQAPPERF